MGGEIKMNNFCSLGGSCKTSDQLWGIINPTTDKLHKLSFSKNLIKHIAETTDGYSMAQFKYKLGDTIKPGERSKSGLYGIMSTHKDILLRVQLDH